MTECQKSFNLIITDKVEDKIRHLLKKVYNTEWSGVLFYTHNNKSFDEDLELTCVDILPMNIGNATFTSFEINPTVISYMTENDLLNCQMGLIHSHHNMSTFFSGTDMDTLEKEGTARNNFLSLIVNNDGKYSAKITRKEIVVATRNKKVSSPLFDTVKTWEDTDTVEETNVFYYNLKIVIEDSFSELDEVITSLQKSSEKKSLTNVADDFIKEFGMKDKIGNKPSSNKDYSKDWDFDLPYIKSKENTIAKHPDSQLKLDLNDEELIVIPDEVVESAVNQLISGCITYTKLPENENNREKLLENINKCWANRLADPDTNVIDISNAEQIANVYSDLILESMLYKIPSYDAIPDDSMLLSELAMACIEKLDKYKEDIPNIVPYIITNLENYVL